MKLLALMFVASFLASLFVPNPTDRATLTIMATVSWAAFVVLRELQEGRK